MPPPTLLLQLPKPCPESWDAMTPAGAGRHCAACQKTVVDFTQYTDAELLAYFRQARPDSTCGRFRAGQLRRPLASRPAPLRPWQGWLAGLLLAALATPGCTSDAGKPAPAVAVRPPLVISPAAPAPVALPLAVSSYTLLGYTATALPICLPAPRPARRVTVSSPPDMLTGEPAIEPLVGDTVQVGEPILPADTARILPTTN